LSLPTQFLDLILLGPRLLLFCEGGYLIHGCLNRRRLFKFELWNDMLVGTIVY
jgi:hypothetical protein